MYGMTLSVKQLYNRSKQTIFFPANAERRLLFTPEVVNPFNTRTAESASDLKADIWGLFARNLEWGSRLSKRRCATEGLLRMSKVVIYLQPSENEVFTNVNSKQNLNQLSNTNLYYREITHLCQIQVKAQHAHNFTSFIFKQECKHMLYNEMLISAKISALDCQNMPDTS